MRIHNTYKRYSFSYISYIHIIHVHCSDTCESVGGFKELNDIMSYSLHFQSSMKTNIFSRTWWGLRLGGKSSFDM